MCVGGGVTEGPAAIYNGEKIFFPMINAPHYQIYFSAAKYQLGQAVLSHC
jgi:hypothetical protein